MKKIFLCVCAIFLATPFLVYGAAFKSGDSYDLAPNSVLDDNLYAAASNIGVAGAVNGDVFAAGNNITVSGQVNGDVISAGQMLNVGGTVMGSVIVGGNSINISNSVGGDLLAGGQQISVVSGTLIGKDVRIAGNNINFSGEAGRSVAVSGNTVTINGTVKGDLSVWAEKVQLGPNASIEGNFDYYSKNEATIDSGATVKGNTNFHKTEVPQKMGKKGAVFGFTTSAWILKAIMLFVAALIVFYFFRKQQEGVVKEAETNFWREALRGFVVLIVVPVAVIMSFITVVGVPLGFVVLFFYIALIIVSWIVAVLLFARLSLKYIFKKENYELNWWVIALSAIVLTILSFIPVVNLINFFIFLATFGVVTNYVYRKSRE